MGEVLHKPPQLGSSYQNRAGSLFAFDHDGAWIHGVVVSRRETVVKGKSVPTVFLRLSAPDGIEVASHDGRVPGEVVKIFETVQLNAALAGVGEGEVVYVQRVGEKRGAQGKFFELDVRVMGR